MIADLTFFMAEHLDMSVNPTMVSGLIIFTSGNSELCAKVAASAVLPHPAVPDFH